uniref:Uncharacterized protein n=1 Tax=Arundo donax TaxID=35708 RepID=A0A0A9EYE8_ARUDO
MNWNPIKLVFFLLLRLLKAVLCQVKLKLEKSPLKQAPLRYYLWSTLHQPPWCTPIHDSSHNNL